MRILESALGPTELQEGQMSERFLLIEKAEAALTPVALTDADLAEAKTLARKAKADGILLALEGRFQMGDTLNANNRIYPDSIWGRVLKSGSKYLLRIQQGDMLGERDHPKDGETRLERVAGRVTKLWRNSNNSKEILGRFVIFNNDIGRHLKAIHDGGGRLGVSSRGQGSVVRLDGKDVVQEDFDLNTWDVVHNPSTPGAYPEEVTESVSESMDDPFGDEDMSKRLKELEERLSRLRGKDLNESPKEAVELIKEGVEEIQTALTTENFGEHTPGAVKLVTEATNFVRDLDEHLAKPEKGPQRPPEQFSQPLTETKTQARPSTKDEVLEFVVKLDVPATTDIEEASTEIRTRYRQAAAVEGALHKFELEGISEAADRHVSETDDKAKKAPTIRLTIGESTYSADSELEVDALIKEHAPDATVVIIDRSEAIYAEAARNFNPLLEAQTLKAESAVRDAASNRSELSELSAKLAASKNLIEGFARTLKEEREVHESKVAQTSAAITLLEAVSERFEEEQLRGAVAALAGTHPNIEGLADALSQATNVEEAVQIANTKRQETIPVVEREPEGVEREKKVEEAIKLDEQARTDQQQRESADQKFSNREARGRRDILSSVVSTVQSQGLGK